MAQQRAYNNDYASDAYAAPYVPTASPYHSPSPQRQHTLDNYSGTTVAGSGSGSRTPVPNGNSPFDSVFDDHVYPAGTYQQHQQHQQHQPNEPYPASPYDNGQHLHAQDTGYYGNGGLRHSPSNESMRQAEDGIPLRDRAGVKGLDFPDHVYDIPQGSVRGGGAGPDGMTATTRAMADDQKRKKGPVRFGELGMFGAYSKRIPWVVYTLTLVQIGVFIGEIVRNGVLTGSPIMIHPSFNVMIGPSTYVLINMGSRFVPCMHNVKVVQGSDQTISWPCPNTTTTDALCTLSELCGFGGVPEPFYNGTINQTPEPNQWFRFIVPMFLHAGLIHIGFNLLLQMTMGRDMERAIGPVRFFVVYICSGIFGFVLGGNYAATGISSTGASGSLFGIIALTLLDLFYSWRDRRNPVKDLMFIMLDVIISLVLGLLPGLDNFSHIGGFLMGLALGISVLHSPNALRRRIGEEDASYAAVNANYVVESSRTASSASFLRNPIAFFKARKPLWWAWWLLRAGAIVLVVVLFILLIKNFYVYKNTCGWCKYLSCLPVNNWCEIGNLQLSNTTSTKRDIFSAARHATLF